MARQFTDEERERMARGGAWLREQRRGRGFEHGSDLADALGLKQPRVSAYERGLYPVPEAVARDIARVLALPETEVWRGLGLPLPREFQSDEEVIAWALRNDPEGYAYWLRRLRSAGATRPGDRPNPVTRKGENPGETSSPEEPAV